jgi:CYTH domain-containing protein
MTTIYSNKSLKYARIEEERRFLLSKMPADRNPDDPFVRIIDYYIEGTRLRLRRIESPEGDTLANKFGQKYRSGNLKAHQTMMTNFYLNEAEYEVLARLPHSTLIKQRYAYHKDGFDYSLDRFEGHLAGLLLAEIESRGKLDITSLPVPEFAIKEVTDDPFFTGSHLAGISQRDFQEWLASRLGAKSAGFYFEH